MYTGTPTLSKHVILQSLIQLDHRISEWQYSLHEQSLHYCDQKMITQSMVSYIKDFIHYLHLLSIAPIRLPHTLYGVLSSL